MKAFAITDIGLVRTNNQDYAYANTDKVGSFPNLFVVADGMGGHKAGELASRIATETVVDTVLETSGINTIQIMVHAIQAANEHVLEKAKESEDYNGMGTTIVLATIMEKMLYVANVGDSRLYVINGNEIEQVTRDHSLVEEMVINGQIGRNEARTHEKKNIITRAVGGEKNLMADYFDVRLKDGDIVLMCTDGLSNMLDDEEIRRIVTKKKEIEEVALDLVAAAKKNGGKDNIGIVLIEP